jgi:hypothetical protein
LGRIVATPQNNHAIYNAFLLVYMPFHVWVFSKLIALKNIKILCAILLLGLLFGYAIEWAHQGFGFYFYRTNTAFSGVVVLLCIVYYFSLFMQNEYYDLLKDASFWFVTGCLIFYATNTAVNAFFAELVRVRVLGLCLIVCYSFLLCVCSYSEECCHPFRFVIPFLLSFRGTRNLITALSRFFAAL